MADQVAIVTGASRGIGFAIAQRFVADGYRVCITGRDAAALDSAAVTGSRELRFRPAKFGAKPGGVSILFPVFFRHPQAMPLPARNAVLGVIPVAEMTRSASSACPPSRFAASARPESSHADAASTTAATEPAASAAVRANPAARCGSAWCRASLGDYQRPATRNTKARL